MNLAIICATQSKLNFKQILLIRILSTIYRKNTEVLINRDIKISHLKKIKAKRIEMDDSLFDFSRYYSGLEAIKESNYIVFAFNDTLGNGRKLNLPLMLFIIQNINNIKKNKYDICCPIDSKARDFWICPYFFLGKISSIKKLNWIDHEKALGLLNKSQISELDEWIQKGWRRSNSSTIIQKKIKYKTLALERTLLKNKYKFKINGFSKKTLIRKLNAISPI